MDYFTGLGAMPHVCISSEIRFNATCFESFACCYRNPTNPRLASSSKDNTVRVWNTASRMSELVLGGHTASVNVVRWGGAGPGKTGVLYTASSDRSVKVWDADKVLSHANRMQVLMLKLHGPIQPQGALLHTLKDHAHWVTTLTLNTDFALRTGPYDHLAKEPKSDEEGTPVPFFRRVDIGSCVFFQLSPNTCPCSLRRYSLQLI